MANRHTVYDVIRKKREEEAINALDVYRRAGDAGGGRANPLDVYRTVVQEEKKQEKTPNVLDRVVGTVQDVTGNVGLGLSRSVEGIVDFAAGLVGTVVGVVSDDAQDAIKGFIKKDLSGAAYKKYLDIYEDFVGRERGYGSIQSADGIAAQVEQAIGGMLPAVAVSLATGGAGAGAAAKGAMGVEKAAKISKVASLATLAAGAAGQSTQEAYRDGASYGRGLIYGAARGATEAGTEMLMGGVAGRVMGTGTGVFDDVVRSVARNKVSRFALEAAGEGLEEVLSEAADPATRTIYKGREALDEYSSPGFAGRLGQSFGVGALTSVAFGQTVGRVTGQVGTEADVREVLQDVDTLGKKRRNLHRDDKLTAEADAKIEAQELEDYREVEGILKKAAPEKRATIMERLGLADKFSEDGTLREDFTASLARKYGSGQVAAEGENGAQEASAGSAVPFERRTASVDADPEAVSRALSKTGRVQYAGELSDTGKQNLKKLKSVMHRFSDLSRGALGQFVIADESAENDAYYDPETGYIVIGKDVLEREDGVKKSVSRAWFAAALHEVTHGVENTVSGTFMEAALGTLEDGKHYSRVFKELSNRGYLEGKASDIRKRIERYMEKQAKGQTLTEREAAELNVFHSECAPLIAERVLNNEHFLRELISEDASLVERLLGKLADLRESTSRVRDPEARAVIKEIRAIEETLLDAVAERGMAYRDRKLVLVNREREEEEGVKESLKGIAEDGKKIYESNFPKGTPKADKSKRILDYIQNVWSKKPIPLVISNGETSRTIYAQFDPTIDETKNVRTDATKLAGGNRHGTASEQRVTLDLADDYYDIASSATYNYSKIETGKDSETHKDVIMWHYFIEDIYFSEHGNEEKTPYTVTINVKEKENGDFVYSFNAEKESSTRQTLHADVNTRKGANGELFLYDSIHDQEGVVNTSNEKNQEKILETAGNGSDQVKQSRKPVATRPTAEEIAERRERALETFGTTGDFKRGGFILPDGRMLNLSEYGLPGVNHSRIKEIFDGVPGSEAVARFISDGNVRVMEKSPGIEITADVELTPSQYSMVGRFVSSVSGKGRFYVDVSDADGKYIGSISYERTPNAEEVVYDIKSYFRSGEIPEVLYSKKKLADRKDKKAGKPANEHAFDDAVARTEEREAISDGKAAEGNISSAEKVADDAVTRTNEEKVQVSEGEDVREEKPSKETSKKKTAKTEEQGINEYKLPEDPRELELRGDQRKALANWSRNKVYSRKDAMEIVDGVVQLIDKIASGNSEDGKNFHVAKVLGRVRERSIDQLFAELNTAGTPTEREAVAQKIAEQMIAEARVEVFLSDEETAHAHDTISMLQEYRGSMNLAEVEDEAKKVFGKGRTPLTDWRSKESGRGMTPMEVRDELAENYGILMMPEDPLDIVLWMDKQFSDATDKLSTTGRYLLKDSLEGAEYDLAVIELAREIVDGFAEKGQKSAKASMQEEHQRQMKAVRDQRDKQIENQKARYAERLEKKEGYFQGRLDSQEAYFQGRLEKKEAYFQGKLKKIREETRTLAKFVNLSRDIVRVASDLFLWKNEVFFNHTGIPDVDLFRRTLGKLTTERYRGHFNQKGARKCIEAYGEWYLSDEAKRILGDGEDWGVYSAEIAEKIQTVANGTKPLTVDDLQDILDIMNNARRVTESYATVFKNGKRVDAHAEAKEYELQIATHVAIHDKVKSGIMDFLFRQYGEQFGEPAALFHYIDRHRPGFLTDYLDRFREASIQAQAYEFEMLRLLDEVLGKHKGYLQNAHKRTVTYKDGTGATYDIPADVATAFYMSLLSPANVGMLAASGFAYRDAKGKEHRPNGFMLDAEPYMTDPDTKRVRVTEEAIARAKAEAAKLKAQFTEADIAYIKAVDAAFKRCRELKTVADLERNGWTNTMKNGYFPVTTAYTAKQLGDWRDEIKSVSQAAFNHHRTEGNRHEVRFSSLDDIARSHIHGIAMYAGLGQCMDDFQLLYNMDVSGNPNKPVSIRTELARLWPGGGQRMEKYLTKFLEDVQGKSKPEDSTWAQTFDKVRGNVALSHITGNVKVLLTQTSSYIAAGNVIDMGNLLHGINPSLGKDVDKYSTLAMLRHEKNEAALAQGVLDRLDGIHEFIAQPIGFMDRRVIVHLFAACQDHVAKTQKLEIGTEENKRAAGKILDRIILDTQQSSLVTERSAAMRSKNVILRMFTTFTADSMKQIARLWDGFSEMAVLTAEAKFFEKGVDKARMSAARKRTVRAAAVLAVQSAYMVAIAWIMRKLLKKDDEEETAKDLALDFTGNLLSGLPVIRDVYDGIVQEYGAEDMSIGAFNDVVNSIGDLVDMAHGIASGELAGRQVAYKTRQAIFAIGSVAGIPTRNLYNFARAIVHWVSPEAGYKMDDAFYKSSYRADMADAIASEDEEQLETIIGVMLNENVGRVTSESVRVELGRLMLAGEDALPRSVPEVITVGDDSVKLTARQRKRFESIYGEANAAVEKMIGRRQYGDVDDAVRAKAIKQVYGIYYNRAVEELLGVELEAKNVLFAEAFDPGDLALIVAACGEIRADVGADGKAISGSRKEKVIKYVESLRLRAAQKYMIMGYLGYKNTTGRQVVFSYIESLRISKAKKEALFEMSGYKLK